MTDRQRDFARHALGLPNKKNMTNRNSFCIGSGGDGYEDWEDLVRRGLAVKRDGKGMFGGDDIFHLTLEGALAVRLPKEHLSREDPSMLFAAMVDEIEQMVERHVAK